LVSGQARATKSTYGGSDFSASIVHGENASIPRLVEAVPANDNTIHGGYWGYWAVGPFGMNELAALNERAAIAGDKELRGSQP
jgi:hypothetical protein